MAQFLKIPRNIQYIKKNLFQNESSRFMSFDDDIIKPFTIKNHQMKLKTFILCVRLY